MKIIAIIPARGGSKGIAKKNIIDLAGKPLMAWSIDAALQSAYISKTIVSSDDQQILAVAAEYGAQPLLRSKDLATDSSPTAPLVVHALEHYQALGEKFDYMVLLQPTSPLRQSKDIDQAIEQMIEQKASALISVFIPKHTPFKAFKENAQGFLEGLVDNETPFKRRQDLPPTYMPNGAIYIVAVASFLKSHQLFTDNTIPYIMPESQSLDIDTLDDMAQALRHFLHK